MRWAGDELSDKKLWGAWERWGEQWGNACVIKTTKAAGQGGFILGLALTSALVLLTILLFPVTNIANYRINNQIQAAELRVVDEQGENLGVMTREKAFQEAAARGVDVIEIAPNAKPPVARLMSFDKFRYMQEKQEKKERASQKANQPKQIQISARAATNDLQVKLKKLEEFLQEGRPVEIQMRLKGREKGNKAWAEGKLREFMSMITTEYKIVTPPRFGGRGMTAQIIKK